jgi:hypothetical protein
MLTGSICIDSKTMTRMTKPAKSSSDSGFRGLVHAVAAAVKKRQGLLHEISRA